MPRARIGFAEGRLLPEGDWIASSLADLERDLQGRSFQVDQVVDASAIESMDTAGAWYFEKLFGAMQVEGLKSGHRGLVDMVSALDISAPLAEPRETVFGRTGKAVLGGLEKFVDLLSFVGESALGLAGAIARPSRIRWKPILHNLQHAGFDALPIVGLLSFLMGMVIAYQGAEQLARYGANIFVVNLVGLSMLRELGPLLTAIIIAGRSGSAFTAQIGTMKVTEEIDAMQTIGISPMDQLVLPKIVALLVALPLLTVYADILGVMGGMVMASFDLGVSYTDFVDRFGASIRLSALMVGIGKAPVFAAIIAIVGCFQGFRVSGGADSVGQQTTKSVVQSIFFVIVADAVFSVIFSVVNL